MNQQNITIVTCSYLPDLERCWRLCNSVDKYVPPNIKHVLIVPGRDVKHFRYLENQRRTIHAVQDVVPGGWSQLPWTQSGWIDRRGWPVRGWIMQQLTKLSADMFVDTEVILFADSDIQFIRQFDTECVVQSEQVRLHRIPGAKDYGVHLNWHHQAADLLGLEKQYFGSDYVGQLITWRKSKLRALKAHIESVKGKPWHKAVSRCLSVSEYILYGTFVEHVQQDLNAGHYAEADDLCHCCWFHQDARRLLSGEDRFSPNARALLLQSNMELSPSEENKLSSIVHSQLVSG